MRSLLVAGLLASWSANAQAHALDLNTARVSLRDGLVEVVAEWDLFLLVPPSPTEVATATDEALSGIHRALIETIEKGTSLRIDDASHSLRIRGFPSPAELRAIAAGLSSTQKDHGALVRFSLESERSAPHPRQVSFASPASLGPVLVSFVEPRMQLASAGQSVSFAVSSKEDSGWRIVAMGLGLLTMVLAAWHWRSRRGSLQ